MLEATYTIIYVRSEEGGWLTTTRVVGTVLSTFDDAIAIADLMNEADGYDERDEDGEWYGEHYTVLKTPVLVRNANLEKEMEI